MQPTWHSRGYLPHCDGLSRQQFITYRLCDSLPATVVKRLDLECPGSDQDPERRARIDAFLDAGHGCCLLKHTNCARIVEDNLLHFDGVRYRLIAWVIMPNHVHVLVEIMNDSPVADLVHSWKSYSATRINRLMIRSGSLWQREYWDRYIRDEAHLHQVIAYIHDNPVTCGLSPTPQAWSFSSASRNSPSQ
jgi:putative transposase